MPSNVLVRQQQLPGGGLRRSVRQGTQQQAPVDGWVGVDGADGIRQRGGTVPEQAADLYAASGAAGGGAFFIGQVSGTAANAENGQGRNHAPMAQGGGPAAQVQGQALRHGSAAQQGRHGGSPHSYSPEKRRMSRETGA